MSDGEKVLSIEEVPEVASSSVVLPDGGEVLFRLFEEGHWSLFLKGDGITTLQAAGQLARTCWSRLPEVREDAA